MARAKAKASEPKLEPNFLIADITADKEMQARAAMNLDAIADYADTIFEGTGELPPIEIVTDGQTNWVTDGWHRLAAYKKLDILTIPARITEGTKADAVRAALAANRTHGLRRSNADKRKAVEMAFSLMAAEKKNWPDTEIAELCGVSSMFVGNVRKDAAPDTKTGVRTKADGTTVTVGNTGRRASEVTLIPISPDKGDTEGDTEPEAVTIPVGEVKPLEGLKNAPKAGPIGVGLDGMISATNKLEVAVAGFMAIFPNPYLLGESLGANPATATTFGRIRGRLAELLITLQGVELPYAVSEDTPEPVTKAETPEAALKEAGAKLRTSGRAKSKPAATA